jgi:hypothetical protein
MRQSTKNASSLLPELSGCLQRPTCRGLKQPTFGAHVVPHPVDLLPGCAHGTYAISRVIELLCGDGQAGKLASP